jgi:hypothetical protein
LTVKNHFAEPLAWVYARGSGDAHYWGANIPTGATALLAPWTLDKLAIRAEREAELKKLMSRQGRRAPDMREFERILSQESETFLDDARFIAASPNAKANDFAPEAWKPRFPLSRPGSYMAVMPGTPFTETFLSVHTESSGNTRVYGAFAREESP